MTQLESPIKMDGWHR